MKEKLLSVHELFLGLAHFVIMLFLFALVFSLSASLFLLGTIAFLPILSIFWGISVKDSWYFFPLGIFSSYLCMAWIEVSPKILEAITPKNNE